jgi:citrate synthase
MSGASTPRKAINVAELTFPTALGVSTTERISLLGQDLADDVMGNVGFGELAFWLAARRRPTPGETRLFEAVLAGLADHGFTPTAIATRLTYLSAPESVQGALAAGVLGAGSRFLGVTEDSAAFLSTALSTGSPTTDAGWDQLARTVLQDQRDRSRRIPGLGHHIHHGGDPRATRLYALAEEENLVGPHLRLLRSIDAVHPEILGRRLPLNGAGVSGAALADLRLPLELLRGFAVLARTAGLIGQLAEELAWPVGSSIYQALDSNSYARPLTPPDAHDA